MKSRKLALILCLTLMLSVLSPGMAFASSPEPTTPVDDPLDPEPYTYLNSIGFAFHISNSGDSTVYSEAFVPDSSYHYTLTVRLQQKVNGVWDKAHPIATWSSSGTRTVYVDETYDDLPYGTYRLAGTVNIYDSNNIKVEAQTEYSSSVTYSSSGSTNP